MWLFLSDAMFSIIATDKPNILCVRARIKGDIERAFPKAKVQTTPKRDYRFRTFLHRDIVDLHIAIQVRNIDYTNFKDSVKDKKRHDAYLQVWSAMWREQARRYQKQTKEKWREFPWLD